MAMESNLFLVFLLSFFLYKNAKGVLKYVSNCHIMYVKHKHLHINTSV